MKLPNAERAQVRRGKIAGYLLSSTLRDGRSKHDFFVRFGFRPEAWEQLAHALIQQASEYDVASQFKTPFGIRYVIDGLLHCPDGREPVVRSVWFMRIGEDAPELVTAYPARR